MSSLRLINETSFTSVSNVNIEDVFTNDFNIYKLSLNVTNASGGGVSIEHRLINSSGDVVKANDYDFASRKVDASSTYSNADSTTDANDIRGLGQIGSDAHNSAHAIAYYFNPFSSSRYTFATIQSSYFGDASPDRYFGYFGMAVLKQQASITGIHIFSTSPTITGTARVYGLRVDS